MSSSGETSEISGTSDARDARAPRRVGVARAAGAFLLVASVLTACNADRLTGPVAPDAGGAVAPTGATELSPTLLEATEEEAETAVVFEGWVETNCNGEVVPMRGKARFELFVSDQDVTHQRVQMHWVADGEGSFGNVYHGSSQYEEVINVSILPLTWTTGHQLTLKSKNPDVPDLRVKFLFHLTISGTGKTTATVEKGSPVACQ